MLVKRAKGSILGEQPTPPQEPREAPKPAPDDEKKDRGGDAPN